MNSTETLTVTGMTCANCARHVTEALESVAGVRTATVDLERGTAKIETERPVGREVLAAALDEAGYGLA